jgi:hypothetical protein
MDTHVKILGALEIALSSFALIGAFVLMLVFGGAMGIVGASGDQDAVVAMPIIGLTGLALVSFLLVVGLPGFIVGIGLLQRRPWARIGGIVVSIISLPGIPFGTALGIYGLWVLFSKETEQLFATGA